MTLDLARQRRSIEPILFPNGEEYACLPINAIGIRLLKGVDLNNPSIGDMDKFYAVIGLLVPDAPTELVDALEPDLITAIVLHSQGRLEEVQAELGKESATPVEMST